MCVHRALFTARSHIHQNVCFHSQKHTMKTLAIFLPLCLPGARTHKMEHFFLISHGSSFSLYAHSPSNKAILKHSCSCCQKIKYKTKTSMWKGTKSETSPVQNLFPWKFMNTWKQVSEWQYVWAVKFQYSNGVLARIISHFSVVHLSLGTLNS